MQKFRIGLAFGISANVIWGFLPIYWKSIHGPNALEILANRGTWALLFCVLLLIYKKKLINIIVLLKNGTVLKYLLLSSILLSVNWGVFIWAVSVGKVVESALGYYISPLVNVLFGILIFKEKLRLLQKIAVALGAISVLELTYEYHRFPWVAFALASSWGLYGFIKKKIDLGALETLTIETMITFFPNLFFLTYLDLKNENHFGNNLHVTFLLIFAGVATIIPLLFFNGALLRLPLSTIGLLQYLTPTFFFILGVFVFKEEMSPGKFIGFALIWGALFALGTDLVKNSKSQ